MRIRSTKPEFWRSRTVASVDWDARFVLKGLESYVDDNGVGKDDLELIVGDLFSRDLAREPSRTLARVSEAISQLHQAGLLWRYEHEGRPLLYISNWDSIQRVDKPQAGRNPRPDGTWGYKDSLIRESVATPREASRALAPVTGEQGNRGTGEQTLSPEPAPPSQADEKFEEFWDVYSKKTGKKDAQKKWALALKKPGITPEFLIEAAGTYIAGQRASNDHPKFTKDPAKWLSGEHWNDETTNVHQLPQREPDRGTDEWNRRYEPWMFQ